MDPDESEQYARPLTQAESDNVKKKRLSIRATRRVLAPYVKARQKKKVEEEENKYFSFYVQKKPSILMGDMSKMPFEGVDLLAVMIETAHVLKESTNSAAVTVYMVDEALEEIYQVTPNSLHEEHRVSYKIQTGTNVAAHVACTKNIVNIPDLLEDIRFPDGLGMSEVTVKAVLCVPVLTPEEECIAVFVLQRDMDQEEYWEGDLRLVMVMSGWVGSTIYQNQQKLTLMKQQELNEYLLDLTKCYFADAMLLDKLISEVVNIAKLTLNAEHGLFFVMKPKHNETYADFYEEGVGENNNVLYKKNVKVRVDSAGENIMSLVAQEGITMNIKNAYTDNRIDQDKRKGYVTRSLICIPIKGVDDILGAIQLVNKKNGSCFTKADEHLFNTFSIYCSFVLSYARLYEKMSKTNNLNSVYAEMLTHQMLPCVHDYYFVSNHPEVPSIPPRFNQFDFYIADTYEHYMPQLVMYMFNEVSHDMFETVQLLARFVLTVQKGYNDNAYHNFHHAFNVTHCIYNILLRNKELFTIFEARALLLSAYCHDIDHYGTTNNFLYITNHFLAQLYEESILENHHYQTTAFIIKFLKLFTYMSTEDYHAFLGEIRFLILATDLATYFRRRVRLYQICSDNLFDWADETHKSLLRSIMMTMADLSGSCKPYSTAKVITANCYKEFYEEGDKEKKMGLCPLSIMDRDKANLVPLDQIQFMTVVVMPCALILTKLMPNCSQLYKEAVKLRETWQELHETAGQKLWSVDDSFPEAKKIN